MVLANILSRLNLDPALPGIEGSPAARLLNDMKALAWTFKHFECIRRLCEGSGWNLLFTQTFRFLGLAVMVVSESLASCSPNSWRPPSSIRKTRAISHQGWLLLHRPRWVCEVRIRALVVLYQSHALLLPLEISPCLALNCIVR